MYKREQFINYFTIEQYVFGVGDFVLPLQKPPYLSHQNPLCTGPLDSLRVWEARYSVLVEWFLASCWVQEVASQAWGGWVD